MSSYSGYGALPWGDAAAHALSNLSLGRQGEQKSGEGPPSSAYPPSFDASNPPTSQQGLPYSASPISGVVTGLPYTPLSPSNSYSSQYDSRTENPPSVPPAPGGYPPPTTYPSSSPYPHHVPHSLDLPENLDVLTGSKGKTSILTEALYPPQNPRSESGYPPAPSQYPPNFDESNTGSQGFPKFSPYRARAAAPAVPYPQPEGSGGQGKQKTNGEFDFAMPKYDGSPSSQPGYPPRGSYPSAVPMGYPPQPTAQSAAPARYPGQNAQPGVLTSESAVSSSGESGADEDRGYNTYQQYGYGAGYPPRGYDQPGYSQPGYGCQPTHTPPRYEVYPSYGSAPTYPPACPGAGYAPEAYPSAEYGAYGCAQPVAHCGDGGHYRQQQLVPAAAGAYGAPICGSHGEYEQYRGGHKGHQHKNIGHYVHYEEDHGDHGGHHGGHHGKHGKHKHKHKH